MSEYRVDVIEIKLLPHGNADSLSIVKIMDYTCVVRTADWKDGQLAAYIEPDYVVPLDREEFAFLKSMGKIIEGKGHRVKVKRLRGIMSMGLLIPAPVGSVLGDNVIEQLGIIRYEPTMKITSGGEAISAPRGIHYTYDVESIYRYGNLLVPGEEVVATEKVHGANARYHYNGEMFCGSRTEWKRQDDKNLWWRALSAHPEVRKFCGDHPEITIYGEVYGQVQDLKYGRTGAAIVVFDLLRNGTWIDHDEAREIGSSLPWVPILYRGPYDSEKLFALADGLSIVSLTKQIREGIVVKPIRERLDDHIGRVILKIVSNTYLERA